MLLFINLVFKIFYFYLIYLIYFILFLFVYIFYVKNFSKNLSCIFFILERIFLFIYYFFLINFLFIYFLFIISLFFISFIIINKHNLKAKNLNKINKIIKIISTKNFFKQVEKDKDKLKKLILDIKCNENYLKTETINSLNIDFNTAIKQNRNKFYYLKKKQNKTENEEQLLLDYEYEIDRLQEDKNILKILSQYKSSIKSKELLINKEFKKLINEKKLKASKKASKNKNKFYFK